MWRLLAPLLLLRARAADECPNVPPQGERNVSSFEPRMHGPRAPHDSRMIDVIGLDAAKTVLNEAIVLPSTMASSISRLFWRSNERSAVLLVGPAGLGKSAAVEAAAAAAGAQMLPLLAAEVAAGGISFCRVAASAAAATGKPVVVLVEALEAAPSAALQVRQCLREAMSSEDSATQIFVVATMGRDASHLSFLQLAPFGYVVRLGMPSEAERKQFLLRLMTQIARVDPQWASTLREAAVATLASLTANHTFAEIDLIVRRAFIRSSSVEGPRDPVALHHFEQIIAETPTQAVDAFNETTALLGEPASSSGSGEPKKGSSDSSKKKSKDVKDPMDGIFGWCNFWLPESLHLPPVVWAMIIFGILAHFMARTTYQPYGHRKRRGGANSRSSLFGDMGGNSNPSSLFGDMGGNSTPYPPFGENLNDWYPGSSPFANFPPPPGMSRSGDGERPGEGAPAAAAATQEHAMPSATSTPSPSSAPTALGPQQPAAPAAPAAASTESAASPVAS